MPIYSGLSANTPEGKRTIENLLLLRQQLAAEIPLKYQDETNAYCHLEYQGI